MADRCLSIELMWDISIPQSLEASQQWVLSAMQRYGRELVNMLWRILGNEQDACDAYQDMFLRLAHHAQGAKPENVKAYVFRTAGNTAITILKRRLHEKDKALSGAAARQNINHPANELDTGFLCERLRGAIARLPEQFREVITLHDLGDIPYEQVGSILGITPATARVYRCKAVQLLAASMRKETG